MRRCRRKHPEANGGMAVLEGHAVSTQLWAPGSCNALFDSKWICFSEPFSDCDLWYQCGPQFQQGATWYCPARRFGGMTWLTLIIVFLVLDYRSVKQSMCLCFRSQCRSRCPRWLLRRKGKNESRNRIRKEKTHRRANERSQGSGKETGSLRCCL